MAGVCKLAARDTERLGLGYHERRHAAPKKLFAMLQFSNDTRTRWNPAARARNASTLADCQATIKSMGKRRIRPIAKNNPSPKFRIWNPVAQPNDRTDPKTDGVPVSLGFLEMTPKPPRSQQHRGPATKLSGGQRPERTVPPSSCASSSPVWVCPCDGLSFPSSSASPASTSTFTGVALGVSATSYEHIAPTPVVQRYAIVGIAGGQHVPMKWGCRPGIIRCSDTEPAKGVKQGMVRSSKVRASPLVKPQ